MTSQISTRKLLKQDIHQHSWIWGLTALLHLLTGPVVFLLYISRYSNWTPLNTINRYAGFYKNLFLPWQLFTMIVCITMCITIYRYLFSRRMVDLYHSVPLGREQLFLMKYLHGLLIWLLPFLISFGSVVFLCLIRVLGNPLLPQLTVTMVQTFFLILVCYFIFYHLFLVAVYLSGNVLNMFTNVAVIGLSILGLWYLVFGFAANFFDTYCYTPPNFMTDIVFSLSPFAAPFGIFVYFTEDVLFKNHLLLLSLSILFAILSLGLARYLYRIRPSELAEQGTLFKCYTIPACILATIVLGIAGSLFFSCFSDNSSRLVWGIFGVILCSVLSAGFINSIFHASIKAFFKYKRLLLPVTAFSTFFVVSIQLDLFGYDTYLPDKENIAGIAIYTHSLSDYSTNYRRTENGNLVQLENIDQHVVQEQLITDKELCYNLLNTFIYADTEATNGNSTGFYTKIQLENGRTYTRHYRLKDSLYGKVAPFIEDNTYRDTNYKFSTGAFGYPHELSFSLWDYSISGRLDTDTIPRLMDAYRLDFQEHYTLEELSSFLYVGEISGSYYYEGDYDTKHFSLQVPDNYTRTLAVLTELMPQYLPAVKTTDDIQEIYLCTPNIEAYEISIDNLYEYFGYQVDSSEATKEASTLLTADTESMELSPSKAYSTRLSLTDAESIGELFPLLYFGSYRDLFGRDEYISAGHITTTGGYTVGIYVKPATLPKKYIEQLYETRLEY